MKIMKKIIIVALPLILLLGLNNCKKKTYTLDPPASKVEGLGGDWELYSVVIIDEIDLAKAERDISQFYISDSSTSVLKASFTSADRSFEITPGSMGKNYLPTSGTWSFDDDNYPSYIFLKDDDGIVTRLKLQGPTRPQDQKLKFSFNRFCEIDAVDTEYVGYRYEFNRK